MERLKLYVDDERVEPTGWVRVSTATNALAILATGMVEELSLDHDLDTHVDTRNGESRELTGYEIACRLEEQAVAGNWDLVPRVLRCHSTNPDGRKRIEQAFAHIERLRGGS